MNKFLVIGFVLFLSIISFGQTSPIEKKSEIIVDRQIVRLPQDNLKYKPKISLQTALKIMENFVGKQKIDVSRYYLREVKMITRQNENKDFEHIWFFDWNNDEMILGDYLHILVSMDGKVWQAPTM